MSYTTRALVKTYLGITNTTDDTLLDGLLASAQVIIDRLTGRHFEASTQTRYFDSHSLDHDDPFLLLLDDDLLSVTTLLNGDTATTTISSSDYWLWPRNNAAAALPEPYWGLKMKNGVSTSWQFDTDGMVSVLGSWGWSTAAPDDIVQITKRLTAWLYRQKDAQIFDITAMQDMGVMTLPRAIPKDIMQSLAPYKRYAR